MACYIVNYVEHYITNYIIMIDITWITWRLLSNIFCYIHITYDITYCITCYMSITWIITYDFMSDYIHFTSFSCNHMPPSGEFGGISTRNQGGAPSIDLALCMPRNSRCSRLRTPQYRRRWVPLYVLWILSFPWRKTLAGACRSGLWLSSSDS